MPAFVMQVTQAQQHPDADALRIYRLEAPEVAPCQVVANLDTTYTVGDVVAVARAGSVLADGTTIHKRRLRGVASLGMLLGRIDATPGDDVSATYCRAEAQGALPHLGWTAIGSLSDVVREMRGRAKHLQDFRAPVAVGRAKVKLHGTHGTIQVTRDGRVAAQSRNMMLDPVANDSMGFARWVEARRAAFAALASDRRVVIYGEFCGSGVQRGVSISQIDRRIFAIFALQFGDDRSHEAMLEVDPERMSEALGELPDDTFILPWYGPLLPLDFGDRAALDAQTGAINEMVAAVEACDPWVASTFGVQGLGEGVVVYPVTTDGGFDVREGAVSRDQITDLMFKAKGQKHAVKQVRKPAQVDPEVARSIDDFVAMFVTEARCEQGLSEACQGVVDKRRTGPFLKWMSKDVLKESVAELEAAGLSWSQVNKAVSGAARRWYFAAADRMP